jgi:GTP-binding protein
VIDASEGDAGERFATIDRELGAYGAGLDALPQIVVLNKIDIVRAAELSTDDPRVLRVVRTSAATGEGINNLKRALFELCPAAPEPTDAAQDGLVDYLVYRPRPERAGYRIFRTDRGFRVVGSLPEREELEEALRAAGAKAGAEVELGDEIVTL